MEWAINVPATWRYHQYSDSQFRRVHRYQPNVDYALMYLTVRASTMFFQLNWGQGLEYFTESITALTKATVVGASSVTLSGFPAFEVKSQFQGEGGASDTMELSAWVPVVKRLTATAEPQATAALVEARATLEAWAIYQALLRELVHSFRLVGGYFESGMQFAQDFNRLA